MPPRGNRYDKTDCLSSPIAHGDGNGIVEHGFHPKVAVGCGVFAGLAARQDRGAELTRACHDPHPGIDAQA